MKKTEHTLIITGSLPPIRCGIGFYTDRLLHVLKDSIDIHVLTSAGSAPSSTLDNVHETADWKIRKILKIVGIIKADQPKIIHFQYPAVGYKRELGINLLPLFLRLLYRKAPIVITLHEYHSSALLGRLRTVITAFFCTKIIVSNESDKIALPLLLRRKSVIIPIGSNIKKVAKNPTTLHVLLKKHSLSSALPTVVYFGFTNEAKGVHFLAEASPLIKANVLLITELSAKDTYQSKVMASVNDSKHNGANIAATGYLDDATVSEVLQESTAFVLPQPLPITAKSGTTIAAIQHGLVIISTENPDTSLNLPYVNGSNSILIPKMTVDNLATAINSIIDNKELASTIRANLPKLTNYFSWEDIAKKHTKLYESF